MNIEEKLGMLMLIPFVIVVSILGVKLLEILHVLTSSGNMYLFGMQI